jgi:hypothetical protein
MSKDTEEDYEKWLAVQFYAKFWKENNLLIACVLTNDHLLKSA